MKKFFTSPGIVTGFLSMIGVFSIAMGKPALGSFFQDPNTAQAVTGLVSGCMALTAGFMDGLKKTPAQ